MLPYFMANKDAYVILWLIAVSHKYLRKFSTKIEFWINLLFQWTAFDAITLVAQQRDVLEKVGGKRSRKMSTCIYLFVKPGRKQRLRGKQLMTVSPAARDAEQRCGRTTDELTDLVRCADSKLCLVWLSVGRSGSSRGLARVARKRVARNVKRW